MSVPLLFSEELFEEGAAMEHCVVYRCPEVMEGHSAIYAATVGDERLTVELVHPCSADWTLGEVRGRRNVLPTEEAVRRLRARSAASAAPVSAANADEQD